MPRNTEPPWTDNRPIIASVIGARNKASASGLGARMPTLPIAMAATMNVTASWVWMRSGKRKSGSIAQARPINAAPNAK